MRLLTRITAPLIITSLALAACQAQSEKSLEIFDTVKSSEYFASNATQIACEGNANFPESEFTDMCLKMGVQTFDNQEQAGQLGMALGIEVAVPFAGSDWELQTDHPDGIFYQKHRTKGCFDRIFVDMDEAGNIDERQDYPFKAALVLGFYKTREAVCAKT